MFQDITGKKYGRLLVIKLHHIDKNNDYRIFWLCKCDCGQKKIIRGDGMKSGRISSCGCSHIEHARKIQLLNCYKHGKAGTKVFNTFLRLKDRCNRKRNPAYKDYGGRGIKCEWKTFEEFYADMGEPPTAKHSIERIDNNGNYSKNNCRWATIKEQANNRRTCVNITFKGITKNMKQWAEEIGITHKLLFHRLKVWPLEKALTQPHRYKKYKNWKGVKGYEMMTKDKKYKQPTFGSKIE